MTEAVLPLDHELCESARVAGNKASTLARLIRHGYPVPAGACITTEAMSGSPSQWEAALESSLSKIAPPWIVRSSSTAEDGASHALPGAFISIAGVCDRRSLTTAIAEVQASLTSSAAKRRAAQLHVDLERVGMAVLIQGVVPATAGGVAFGCDPVSGAPTVVIEANHGLPQTVVDGSITPDGFEVPREAPMAKSHGTKLEKVDLTSAGDVERKPTSAAERSAFAITDGTVTRLAALVRRVGEFLGAPQDVEWATVGRELFLLQARPITTVAPRKGEP